MGGWSLGRLACGHDGVLQKGFDVRFEQGCGVNVAERSKEVVVVDAAEAAGAEGLLSHPGDFVEEAVVL